MKAWFLVLFAACQGAPPPPPVPIIDIPTPPEVTDPEPSASAVEPAPSAVAVKEADFSKILGTYETRYQAGGNRGSNIERAASFFKEGIVLEPGDTLSFNTMVGPRSESNGFKPAPVIVAGELTEGDGGGTCQVSSTLHAAAVMSGGIEVVSRTPHSRPSSYIPYGLDATVVWPDVDLKLKNARSLPVKVVMTVVESSKLIHVLHVELQGGEDPIPKPTYTYGVEMTDQAFARRMKVRGGGSGSKKVQHGMDGRIVHSILTGKDGKVLLRWESRYPPTDEIWEVGHEWSSDTKPWEENPDAGTPDGGL